MERRSFCLIDLVIGIAGVAELLIAILGVAIYPFSEFNFNISAMQKLFLVRTKDTTDFDAPTEEPFDLHDQRLKLSKESIKEISMHKKINLRSTEIVKLYLFRALKFFKMSNCIKS